MNSVALGTLIYFLGIDAICGLKVCPYLRKNSSGITNRPVLIPGFEKCGTTELFHILNSSGCFKTGKKKELKFLNRFCVSERTRVKKKLKSTHYRHCPNVTKCSQLSDYLHCWPNDPVAPPLDGTPAYSHTILLHQNKLVSAATELQYLTSSSSSIWLLRNPVERTISSYYFFRVRNHYVKCTLERKVQQEIEFLQGNRFLTQLFLKPPEEITPKNMTLAWARLRRNFREFGYKKYSKYCPATPEIIIGSFYLPMLVHWVSSLKGARHMFLCSESFFSDPEYIAAEYIEPFVFQSKKIPNFKQIENNIISFKPDLSNKGKYNRDEGNEIKCILKCFFAPFTANLFKWLIFLQTYGNVEVYPSTSAFGWSSARICNCNLSAHSQWSE